MINQPALIASLPRWHNSCRRSSRNVWSRWWCIAPSQGTLSSPCPPSSLRLHWRHSWLLQQPPRDWFAARQFGHSFIHLLLLLMGLPVWLPTYPPACPVGCWGLQHVAGRRRRSNRYRVGAWGTLSNGLHSWELSHDNYLVKCHIIIIGHIIIGYKPIILGLLYSVLYRPII